MCATKLIVLQNGKVGTLNLHKYGNYKDYRDTEMLQRNGNYYTDRTSTSFQQLKSLL